MPVEDEDMACIGDCGCDPVEDRSWEEIDCFFLGTAANSCGLAVGGGKNEEDGEGKPGE